MTDTHLYDSLASGIAVLADESTATSDGPWDVNGVALTENALTVGQSGQPRFWPADTLADAASALIGRPIVKNFHDLDGQAPADDVIGKVTDAGYEDGVGIVYEGEISDEAIAKKVERGYLDVSVVPLIGDESYDSTLDAQRVEQIDAFRDIAVVAEGASPGADIELGSNPAVAALSRNLVGDHDFAGDGETDDGSDPIEMDEADEADGGADAEADGDDGETDDPTDAGGDSEGEPVDDDEIEPVTAALKRELSLHTPDRCRTIKDGSKTLDATTDPVARDILGVTGSKPRDVRDDPVARQVVGITDDETEPTEADTVDVETDEVARGAIGLDPGTNARDAGDDDEPEPDVIDVATDPVARATLGLDGFEGEPGEGVSGPVDITEDTVARTVLGLDTDEGDESDAADDDATVDADDGTDDAAAD